MKKMTFLGEGQGFRVQRADDVEFLFTFKAPIIEVVLLVNTTSGIRMKGCILYPLDKRDNQLRLIVDSSYVLTGEMTGDITDSCLYCGQRNFVNVFKDSLRNEIKLIELTKADKKLQ